MKFLTIPLVLFVSIITTSVTADPYVGFGVGSTSYKVDFTSLGGGKIEEDETGTKLFGGYAFNKYFAAEVAYYDFYEASVEAVEITPGGQVFSGAVDMIGFGAYAVGMYPVTKKVNLMAKLGVLGWDADLTVNADNGSNGGTDVAFAVAASYAFTKELLVTAEWESFDSDNPELSLFSVGFKVILK